MDEKKQAKVVRALADLVAWNGHEDHLATCKRLLAAERLLKQVAPDILLAAKAAVPKE